jgi:hypothetical protein
VDDPATVLVRKSLLFWRRARHYFRQAEMKTLFQVPFVLVSCAVLFAAVSTGCSTFNRDWKKAATPLPADGIAGRWEGSWLSEMDGHRGRLRCVITGLADGRYRAHYKATYWKIFRFSYTVEMQVEHRSGDRFEMRGETNLGWWGGGVYQYEGEVSPTNFVCTYRSKYDHGRFRMERPQTPGR